MVEYVVYIMLHPFHWPAFFIVKKIILSVRFISNNFGARIFQYSLHIPHLKTKLCMHLSIGYTMEAPVVYQALFCITRKRSDSDKGYCTTHFCTNSFKGLISREDVYGLPAAFHCLHSPYRKERILSTTIFQI